MLHTIASAFIHDGAHGVKAHADGAVPKDRGDLLDVSIVVVAVSVDGVMLGGDQALLLPVVQGSHGDTVHFCDLAHAVFLGFFCVHGFTVGPDVA